MSNNANSFDFLELGQAIPDAREKQRITREGLAGELGIFSKALAVNRKRGAKSKFPTVHTTCNDVPYIRRPVHTSRHHDRKNNLAPAVGCASLILSENQNP